MGRLNDLSNDDQSQLIFKLMTILRKKFNFQFSSKREILRGGGLELDIFCSDVGNLNKLKSFFCQILGFDSAGIIGHGDTHNNLAIRIDTLTQDYIDSIKYEYKLATMTPAEILLMENKITLANSDTDVRVNTKTNTNTLVVKTLKTNEMAKKNNDLTDETEQSLDDKTVQPVAEVAVESDKPKPWVLAKRPDKKVKVARIPPRPLSAIDFYKVKILRYLLAVVKFENGIMSGTHLPKIIDKVFWFDEVPDGIFYIIRCADQRIQEIVYRAMLYFKNCTEDSGIVTKVEGDIRLDFSEMKAQVKDLSKVYYCMPPKIDTSPDEMVQRLRRAFFGGYPEIALGPTKKNSYSITYKKLSTVKKVFEVTLKMGWNVSFLGDSFICCLTEPRIKFDLLPTLTDQADSKEGKVEPIVILDEVPVSKIAEVLPEVENQEPVLRKYPVSGIVPTLLSTRLSIMISNKEEAMDEIERIFFNPELSANLSPETQRKMISILRESYRKEDPEKYMKHLLAFFG